MSSYDFTLLLDRIRSKFVIDDSGCWIWIAAHDRGGYGHSCMDGKRIMAHRLTYKLLAGTIPEGLELDHLCRIPPCVNPAHLEPVTPQENNRRSIPYRMIITHCKRGHEYTTENTCVSYWHGRKRRRCRTCKNKQLRENRKSRRRVRYVLLLRRVKESM